MRFDVHPTMMKQKQGAPCGRTLKNPRTITICTTERFPIGNALFLFAGEHDESVPPAMQQILFALPRCSNRQGWPGRMPVPNGQ